MIHPRNLTRSPHNSPINTRQSLSLQPKILINRVRLTQHPIHHGMALIDPPPLLEHVVRLCSGGVGGAVGVDVGADVGEEVCAVAGLGDGGGEAV